MHGWQLFRHFGLRVLLCADLRKYAPPVYWCTGVSALALPISAPLRTLHELTSRKPQHISDANEGV